MTFECDPEKANELKPLLYKEVDNIIRERVTEEELSKVVKNTLKKEGIKYVFYQDIFRLPDMKVTKDVQKFAKKFFKDADVIDLIFSPQQK